ncbi:MAG: hypothetical protein EBZ50_07265 [Alphaproteobacteria bacterium]|nr:hypothetical protein [Alphaproteobacteria bacterium]
MITTAYAHDVTRINITRHGNHLDVDLYSADRTLPAASLTAFGDNLARTRPALTVDGADPYEAIAAMRDALALLDEALIGAPSNIPHAVYQAREALARGLTVPTEGQA